MLLLVVQAEHDRRGGPVEDVGGRDFQEPEHPRVDRGPVAVDFGDRGPRQQPVVAFPAR